MHILCFVEEPSAEAALSNLIPKLLQDRPSLQFIVFRGKRDLLNNLEPRLRGYASLLSQDHRIVVLVDEDRKNCLQLKEKLESAALSAGLVTKSRAGGGRFQVLNRIAVEELEAWFLGDVDALREAYPRLPEHLAKKQRYRDPDAVPGGTWEALERALQSVKYYPAGYPKIEGAEKISCHMEPARNLSHSFQVFCQGIRAL